MSRPRRENYSRKSYDPRRAFGSANYLTTVTGGGLTLPRTGLIWTGPVDTIGLSAAALWDALPSYMRSHYLSDRDTKLPDATIIANIQASGFLNVGGGLHGNATKGYAQYQDGTSTDILDKAARYYRANYGWPTDIKSLVIASGGELASPVGPAVAYSAAAGQVAVLPWVVQNSTIAPVGSSGYSARPALTNLFGSSDSPAAARTKTLTAQKYCLQVKTGSATCSYGTATPSAPLQFTATAGNTTFTPTDCDDWCLTASGGYVFMPIPYGQATVSTVGTTAGNGVRVPLAGGDVYDRLIECFRGVPGVDLVTNGNLDTTDLSTYYLGTPAAFNVSGGELVCAFPGTLSSSANNWLSIPGAYTPGDRYLVKFDATYVSGGGSLQVGATYTVARTITAAENAGVKTQYTVEVSSAISSAAAGRGCFGCSNGTSVWKLDNISIQKLASAVGTVVSRVVCAASNADITATHNIITVNDTAAGLLFLDSGGVLKSTDGTNTATATISGGFARGDVLLCFEQVNAAGDQFRVGYEKNASGTITWGSLATYDGSFNPGTNIRALLNNSAPTWLSGFEVCAGSLSDANCLLRGRLLS